MLVGLWLRQRLPELRRHIRPLYAKLGIISES
jgi:hypothetical protein